MALSDILTGYGGRSFPLPEIAGRYKGDKLVICGDAACVWDDLERFGCRCDYGRGSVRKDGWHFMTVNKLVETFPGEVHHAYSNEAHLLTAFIAARRNEYKAEFGWPQHTHSCNKGAQWRWPWSGHGSSLLGATLAAVGMDYAPIVLCGGPLDDGPHNGEPHWRKCKFTQEVADRNEGNRRWLDAKRLAFDGRVTSMSGRTREWLGSPQ